MTAVLTDTAATVVSPAPRSAWQQLHEADPTGLATQSPAWADAMESTGRWRDVSRHYRFADGQELVLPMVRRRRVAGVAGGLHSMPDAWGYGGLVGPGITDDRVGAVLADLAALPTPWVRIRPNPLHATAWHRAATAAGVSFELPKRAHVLRLEGSAEEIFRSSFTSSCRRAIRSAEKAGLTVESDTTGRLLDTFHHLFLQSVQRWAGTQHEPLALARLRANRRDPRSKFEAWSRALDGRCQVLVARRRGEPLAAMIILLGHNAHMTRSAMDRQLVGHDRPNELLMWHAIQGAVAAGCASFHLGESGPPGPLSRYKEKFGAEPFDYAEHRLERIPATAVDRGLRDGVKHLIRFQDR